MLGMLGYIGNFLGCRPNKKCILGTLEVIYGTYRGKRFRVWGFDKVP